MTLCIIIIAVGFVGCVIMYARALQRIWNLEYENFSLRYRLREGDNDK